MTEKSRLPLGIPQLIGLAAVVLLVPWVIMTGKSERDTRQALESYEQFTTPAFPMSFSKTAQFDPLGFMGNGMTQGFWQWSDKGFALADKGRAWFAESPERITAMVAAGRREVSAVNGYQERESKRDARFHWRWTAISVPSQVFLTVRPPKLREEYEGHAVLARKDGVWVVEKLETPDFDIPMAELRDRAAGVVR